jgi:DNA end-binding protein Ku
VTVALRSRTTPAVLRVRDDVLVLQTLMWPDEVRTPAFGSLQDIEDPKPQELKMARLLLETLAGDYDPSELEDDYADAVHALVEAKLAGGEVKQTKEPAPSAGEVVDLLAALQRSVAAAKTARGETEDEPGDQEGDQTGDQTGDGAAAPEEKPKPAKRTTKKASSKGGSKKKTAAKEPARKSA